MIDQIAAEFVRRLEEEIGRDRFLEVARLNKAEEHAGICHSHDFIDANMVMADAFTAATGEQVETTSEAHARLWNSAWEEGKLLMQQRLQDQDGQRPSPT